MTKGGKRTTHCEAQRSAAALVGVVHLRFGLVRHPTRSVMIISVYEHCLVNRLNVNDDRRVMCLNLLQVALTFVNLTGSISEHFNLWFD